jgi:outer membrane biogenesis lipoprotein LolB
MKIMRLQVLLIAAATLLLAGCGGKSANNKADAANDSGKTATTVDPLAGHFEYAIGNMQGSKFLIINNTPITKITRITRTWLIMA